MTNFKFNQNTSHTHPPTAPTHISAAIAVLEVWVFCPRPDSLLGFSRRALISKRFKARWWTPWLKQSTYSVHIFNVYLGILSGCDKTTSKLITTSKDYIICNICTHNILVDEFMSSCDVKTCWFTFVTQTASRGCCILANLLSAVTKHHEQHISALPRSFLTHYAWQLDLFAVKIPFKCPSVCLPPVLEGHT